jgi:hypothetical protein
MGSLAVPGWDVSRGSMNALRWIQFPRPAPRPVDRYVRAFHFGGWIDRPSEPSCLNTRALVLVRDTRRRVTFTAENPCIVATGGWADPYTAKTFIDAPEIQIDHVVPLKHAYIAGAWTWDWKTRCAYSNYMGNLFHLMSVEGVANSAKGDAPPQVWMPPNPAFRCQYLANWLRIKLIWRMMISEPEAAGMTAMLQQLNCPKEMFQVSAQDLLQQRQLIMQSQRDCPTNPSPGATEARARARESARGQK